MNHLHTLRIPSVEPYGYAEISFEGTAEEAIEEQKRLANLFKEGAGVPLTEWRELIKSVMQQTPRTEPIPTDKLSKEQYFALKEIRNYYVRSKDK